MKPRDPFPFNHFSMREVALMEHLRHRWPDSIIIEHPKFSAALGNRRTHAEICQYLARNPRKSVTA